MWTSGNLVEKAHLPSIIDVKSTLFVQKIFYSVPECPEHLKISLQHNAPLCPLLDAIWINAWWLERLDPQNTEVSTGLDRLAGWKLNQNKVYNTMLRCVHCDQVWLDGTIYSSPQVRNRSLWPDEQLWSYLLSQICNFEEWWWTTNHNSVKTTKINRFKDHSWVFQLLSYPAFVFWSKVLMQV